VNPTIVMDRSSNASAGPPEAVPFPRGRSGVHSPVLVPEVLSSFAEVSHGAIVDATVGGGGHAEAILDAFPSAVLLGIDRDPAAVEIATGRLARFGNRARVRLANFRDLSSVLSAERIGGVSAILFDLGTSAMQMDDPARGFSFGAPGPLDMRMGPDAECTAEQLLSARAEELEKIIREYGEERFARSIARAIVAERKQGVLKNTADLARIIAGKVRISRHDRIHPATRTFQAIRIAVNDELAALSEALPAAASALVPGGRMAVIAFHSLEDRIVKRFIVRESRDCVCPPEMVVCRCGHVRALTALTRKPVVPGEDEVARNPRSRSARLRVAEKL
jgi:16S rRNA (cytosine1402-N4)-methyltransferase